MIDYFNLISNDKNTQILYGVGSGVWQTWTKPNNCKFVHMYVMGGGAGGSSGYTDVTFSSNRLGGGGGGSSAITKAFFPGNLIPETLYFLVGMGGIGQTSSSSGTSGEITFISTQPSTAFTANILLRSGNVAPTCSNTQAAGVGGTVFTSTNGLLSTFGVIQTLAGINAAAGGTNASPIGGSNGQYFITGGAGGGAVRSVGNSSNGGGGVTGAGYIPTIAGGTIVGDPNGLSKPLTHFPSDGYGMKNPMTFYGGCGGAGLDLTNGGNGGDGTYGCGGGGGGASTTGNGIGGNGGNGGDGLVIITCW